MLLDLSRITFPFLFFICLTSFFGAILNSYNKFAVAAAAPIILNVILIGSLFFSQWFNMSDVLTLSYAVSLSGFLQLLILLFFVRKNFKPILSIKINIDEKIKFFFRKLLPSIFSSGVTIRGVEGVSGWVNPWIKVINDTAVAVNQLGARAGAISVTLDMWHRDIYDFLDLQTETGDIRRKAFDIFPAVSIPDLFMKRVEEDGYWTLMDPKEVRDVTGKLFKIVSVKNLKLNI